MKIEILKQYFSKNSHFQKKNQIFKKTLKFLDKKGQIFETINSVGFQFFLPKKIKKPRGW